MSISLRSLTGVLIGVLPFCVSTCLGAGAMEQPPGLKIGEAMPAFELKDQSGTARASKDLLDQPYLALVFYRSADW